MRLKSLELYGYKSFASRCTFSFHDGITAIVGPNGSGKSNIADALRWVLGERSFSLLRASSTDDMIFAGSRHRPRLGMAEVLLTLHNEDGALPIAYSEVTIGRRAYRSSENEYLLNGNRVLYREVMDLLSEGGLARSTYTVMGQGMVDAALSLRPEARRELFEEAAGVKPHLRKRESALRRIEETERNLERVTDILHELRPRAHRLQEQAERAEERLLLQQDLRELERIWYGYRWQQCCRDLIGAEEHVANLRMRLHARRARIRDLETKRRENEAHRVAQRDAIEAGRRQTARLRDQADALQQELAVLGERRRLYEQQREALTDEISDMALRCGVLEEEVAHARKGLEEQVRVHGTVRAELARLRDQLAAVDGRRDELLKGIDTYQKRLGEVAASIADGRARLRQLEERREELVAEAQEAGQQLDRVSARRKELDALEAELVEQEQTLQKRERELQGERERLEAQMGRLRTRLQEDEAEISQIRNRRDELVGRQEVLRTLRDDLSGYYPGVRSVLSADAGLSGLLGTVANLIKVPQRLERAVESALGSRLQNVVAETWEDAETAIAYLKHRQGGWATFLPLDTVNPPPTLRVPKGEGVVGVASALVGFAPRARPVFELLLGRVLVVEDLGVARRLLKERLNASLFVTLDGETVHPNGSLSGGSRKGRAQLLAREREWRDLPKHIDSMEGKLSEILQQHERRSEQLEEVNRRLVSCEEQIGRVRSDREAAHESLVRHRQDVRETEREREWLASRAEQLEERRRRLLVQREGTREQLHDAQQQHDVVDEQLGVLRQQMASVEGGGLREKVAKLETRAAVAERAIISQRELLESYRQSLAQLREQMENRVSQKARLEEALTDVVRETKAKASQQDEIRGKLADIEERMEPARQELESLAEALEDIEAQCVQAQDRVHEAETKLNEALLERGRIQDRRDALAGDIASTLGDIELPDETIHQLRLNLGEEVVELPFVSNVPPSLEQEIQHLRNRLRRLSDVNPHAPQEYRELAERQAFLEAQVSDLQEAIGALHKVIEELDRTIERDFVATVESVGQAFEEYFYTLFGGGRAHLELTDPDDVSGTGVEIVACPPGKRMQDLSLLSGGERALTGVALLFALLRANPVPFCFLDEVDAALDEANVGRFRELLEEEAERTQFVLITHNRQTIEAASTIYGISMGESGVSQVLSLELGDERLERMEIA
ncbi:MAG: chromosome segregation protein SMC [Chloroflexota bacterium]|nr:chromosome segregation protein SMC [Chloroflexota bacterium]